MGGFRPNKLSGDFIRDKADSFRRKYINPPTLVPVPIEEIIEFDLKITPWPKNGLLQKIDIDGFLSNDLKYIFIDEDIYNDPRQENRLRFTLAHEVGHFILHRKEIQACKFRSENDWIHFREEIQEEDLLWFEQQAYEFAGRLLVPVSLLKKEIESNSNKIEKFRKFYNENGEELLIQAISRIICNKFGVSEKVISRRIKSEKLSL
ncbi:MAG: ImmA/IrrE family metallo-endopeptidase [Calditrichia bacterium]|nr:ImmA/IrrE family metallo-endopeptidase [Calditrichia bacterium]